MYYGSITTSLKEQLASLFLKDAPHNLEVIVEPIQQQQGGCDCGLFAAAVSINLAFGGDPTNNKWHQNRSLEAMYLTEFPVAPFKHSMKKRKLH